MFNNETLNTLPFTFEIIDSSDNLNHFENYAFNNIILDVSFLGGILEKNIKSDYLLQDLKTLYNVISKNNCFNFSKLNKLIHKHIIDKTDLNPEISQILNLIFKKITQDRTYTIQLGEFKEKFLSQKIQNRFRARIKSKIMKEFSTDDIGSVYLFLDYQKNGVIFTSDYDFFYLLAFFKDNLEFNLLFKNSNIQILFLEQKTMTFNLYQLIDN